MEQLRIHASGDQLAGMFAERFDEAFSRRSASFWPSFSLP
jgi:hypothetical protein